MKIAPVWILALAVSSALAQPSISLSGGSGAPGGTVAVSIGFSSNGTQPTGAQWTLNYSSVDFSLVNIAQTPLVSSISGETFSCPAGPSSVNCIVVNFGSNSVLVPNGTIAIATFHISSTTTNTSSQITLSSLSATDGGASSLGLTGSPATVTINQGTVGGQSTPELLWQNDNTREVAVAYYNGAQGTNAFGWNSLSAGFAGWHVVAAADFDRNGTPDLVWQNETTRQVTVNYYAGSPGATLQAWAWLNSAGIPGWKVVGAADFNGDGVPDLIWQNDITRKVTVQYYGGTQGATFQGWAWLNSAGIPGWTVVGAADFNRDGVPDLIWQNDSTRKVTVHFYGGAQGAVFQGWAWLNSAGIPGWTAVGASDFDKNGTPDLVWLNDATRQVTVHFYNGGLNPLFTGWAWLNSSGIAGWHAIVPR